MGKVDVEVNVDVDVKGVVGDGVAVGRVAKASDRYMYG